MIDFELLLAAAAEEPPCGPNLEYDPDYRELEQMARGKEEKRTGDTVELGRSLRKRHSTLPLRRAVLQIEGHQLAARKAHKKEMVSKKGCGKTT